MFDTIFGLPLHALVVHATVVVVSAAAVAVGLASLWPRFRRWAGILPLLASVSALLLVPVSVQSGQALKTRVGADLLVDRHETLGRGMLPWVLVLTLGAAGLFWLHTRRNSPEGDGRRSGWQRLVAVAVTVVSLIGAVGAAVQVIRIGHSGADAAWSDLVSKTSGN
ncbi:MAG TPA: DUF2231 domain-containing protein [Jiangellales bacterium]|nr:DUF2231 domain-containing protein [Jiangellales bacterium]